MRTCVLGALLSTNLFGSIMYYSADLNGSNENPPNASTGTGTALVTIDTVLQTMRVQVSFSGLLGTTTASHIHCCIAAPGNVGVATTTPTFAGFPLGVTSGTYDNTLDLTLASSYNPAFVTTHGGTLALAEFALLTGLDVGQAYLNIHTTFRPGGEIRGFLIPEPATWGLVGVALAAIGLRRRKRR